ncbi:MAG TPA: hypothetical protein PK228_13715 [Saprospiraceae bacterium]|nr:hypothetical protein [Saprospiraceae bacterium]
MSFYPSIVQFTPGIRWVYLREISGRDELAVGNLGTPGAIQLLDRLLATGQDVAGSVPKAETFVTADRDRLLAVVYKQTYNAQIESTVQCQYCSAPFDLDFSLDDLLRHLQPDGILPEQTDGTFYLENGSRFRLPTGADEQSVSGLPTAQMAQVLLERCLLEGDPAADGEKAQQAMEQIAPVLQTEMLAHCPECEKEQQVHFDLQSFLLTRLKQGQKQVILDIHRLASNYHWSHAEILDLPRNMRRRYVELIESELEMVQKR